MFSFQNLTTSDHRPDSQSILSSGFVNILCVLLSEPLRSAFHYTSNTTPRLCSKVGDDVSMQRHVHILCASFYRDPGCAGEILSVL